MNDFDTLVFRFPSAIGSRLTHGVIYGFVKKLKIDPTKLEILGNGKQNKQYVYVIDLVRGIWDFCQNIKNGYEQYNNSTNTLTNVDTIADLICKRMGFTDVKYENTNGGCGCKGNVLSFEYDIYKARAHG